MNKAVELIKSNPKGLRYSELQRGLQSCFPDTSPNTITESSWNLDVTRSEKIYKPTRGLFKYRLTSEEETERTTEEIPPTLRIDNQGLISKVI